MCNIKSSGKIWFPGGGIDIGELRHEALLREIREETGMQNVKIGKLISSFDNFFYDAPRDFAMQAFLFFYECSTDEAELLPDNLVYDEEARGFRWVEIAQIGKDDLGDLNDQIYDMISELK